MKYSHPRPLIEDLREDLRQAELEREACVNEYGHVIDARRFNCAVKKAREIRGCIDYLLVLETVK